MGRYDAGMLWGGFAVKVNGKSVWYNPIDTNPHNGTGPRKVTATHRYGPTWSAQLFVGLSVGDQEAHTAESIRQYVLNARMNQLHALISAGVLEPGVEHGGSVQPQLGWWGRVGKEIPEKSVSIVIDNLTGETIAKDKDDKLQGDFVDNMVTLAQNLAVDFDQDAVILRLAYAGTVYEVFVIEASRS